MMTTPSSAATTGYDDESRPPRADLHQADPHRRARLRWRGRRGLLENDLIITRFLDRHELELTDDEVGALTILFEQSDNLLLDLILLRSEPQGELDTPAVRNLVQRLRVA